MFFINYLTYSFTTSSFEFLIFLFCNFTEFSNFSWISFSFYTPHFFVLLYKDSKKTETTQ